MPERLDRESYKCNICQLIYNGPDAKEEARKCEVAHDIVYLSFHREDLFRLNQFIMTKDDSLLSERLLKTLAQYNRGWY